MLKLTRWCAITSAGRSFAGGANEMREYTALVLACAAFSAVLAMLVYDLIYPTDLSVLEPDARLEYEVMELNAKKEVLLILIGGLIAWISQGKGRD